MRTLNGIKQDIGLLDERMNDYREAFTRLLDEWKETRKLLGEMIAGQEDSTSPWYRLDLDAAIYMLHEKARFRILTPLGTLGGQEPEEMVAFLSRWQATQKERIKK
jgi:hypothetical protein